MVTPARMRPDDFAFAKDNSPLVTAPHGTAERLGPNPGRDGARPAVVGGQEDRPVAACPASTAGPDNDPLASLPIRSAERRRWAADLTGPERAGLVLHGAGGIGKSTLASQIVSRVSHLEPERVTAVIRGEVSVERGAGRGGRGASPSPGGRSGRWPGAIGAGGGPGRPAVGSPAGPAARTGPRPGAGPAGPGRLRRQRVARFRRLDGPRSGPGRIDSELGQQIPSRQAAHYLPPSISPAPDQRAAAHIPPRWPAVPFWRFRAGEIAACSRIARRTRTRPGLAAAGRPSSGHGIPGLAARHGRRPVPGGGPPSRGRGRG